MNVPSPLATIPNARSARWMLLRDVAAQWYPPISTDDGVPSADLDSAESRLDVSFPVALREWYTLAGRRTDIWSRQDRFLSPDEFRINGDHVIFLIENQDVVEWGIRADDLGLDDPPVYSSSVDDPKVWLRENDSISEFALQMFAYCLKWSNKNRWWANAYVASDILECVAADYPRLPFAEWHWPAPTRFYGIRDTIVEVEAEPDHDHAWLYVVTRTATATESFKDIAGGLNIEWNSWSDDWPPGWVTATQDLDG